ncbi:hypothetical protein F7R91_07820 [Streptomyces luteolifulvus]|jgi:hypothetical protein|uniref:Uncharacterized protein n=1 Tax=Streptomyces luteolifulvus TaxID=2615112 RepID=A0A6H9V4V9_9ACTN|nr:DUF6766 family protein [Streptomyces luteolifulvus]KAB1148690.1 hypothetical protein F7R91_07820 [Streptomyces luteolifulvus]
MTPLTRFVKHNSLTLAFGTGFLLTLAGQAVSGHADFNNQLVAEGLHPLSFWQYLATSDFAVEGVDDGGGVGVGRAVAVG